MLNRLKNKYFFYKKGQKLSLTQLCQIIYSRTRSMQKNNSPFIRLCQKFLNLSYVKANFRFYIKQRFWRIIKYLSTFYIRRFKRAISNQRNVHRRFPTTTCIKRIDQFWHQCQRTWRNCQKLRYLKKLPKIMIFTRIRGDWSMIVWMKKCFSARD